MADINVFELTNAALSENLKADKKSTKRVAKKSVKESFVKKSMKRRAFNIPANKLRVESIKFFEDEDTRDEATDDYTPEDDVVLVIDPEMEETPESVEDAEVAAEELVGEYVCKCSICGANYVCDHEEVNEDMETEEDTCPVCGETGEQIVVGEITPTEEISNEDEDELTDIDDEVDVDVDVDVDDDEDDDFEESIRRAKRSTKIRRTESRNVRRTSAKRSVRARRTESKPVARRTSSAKNVMFDEATMNRMLTRFAKENYSNVKFVRIKSGSIANKRLSLEGVVTTTRGNKTPIKFVCENFRLGNAMSLSFNEFGPFTESVKNRNSFVLECKKVGNIIKPVTLKYNYKVKESKNMYQVSGKVLSEGCGMKKSTSTKRKPAKRSK